jgi:hypothetical protein
VKRPAANRKRPLSKVGKFVVFAFHFVRQDHRRVTLGS